MRSHFRSVGRLIATILALALLAGEARANQTVSPPALKAAFLLNFVKFSEWPAGPGPIVICVAGDDQVADALAETIKGHTADGRTIAVQEAGSDRDAKACQVLYISGQGATAAGFASTLRDSPVLTVSDATRFTSQGGIIELYVEAGKMRFAVNVDNARRSGVQLNARLLALARIVKDSDAR